MISLTAAETATAWATLDGVALQTSDTSADCFKLIVGSTGITWGVVGASFFVPSVFLGPICFFKLIKNAVTGPIIQRMKGMVIFLRLVQSRLRSDEARHALDESIDALTNEQEAVRNTKSAAGRGKVIDLDDE